MPERQSFTLDSGTLVGRAVMFQVLSIIMIIGSLVVSIPILDSDQLWMTILSGLIVVAFFQALVTRAILQKEEWGLSAANAFSILAFLLSIIAGFYWIIQQTYILLGLYLIVVAMVNVIVIALLLEARKTPP